MPNTWGCDKALFTITGAKYSFNQLLPGILINPPTVAKTAKTIATINIIHVQNMSKLSTTYQQVKNYAFAIVKQIIFFISAFNKISINSSNVAPDVVISSIKSIFLFLY